MKYTINDIAQIIQAKTLQHVRNDSIAYLLHDSRKILFPSSSLFFALKGPRRNGNEYIEELSKKGVYNYVVDDSFDPALAARYQQANFLQVKDVLNALQQLSASHRKNFAYPVIGITGSNGKTIVKEWLYQLLNSRYKIVRSPKSFNSQIGVPLSVWQMTDEYNMGIFEAGISTTGEMIHLSDIIQPDLGILTVIGDAHAEGFESVQQKINEKLLLFRNSELLFYSTDDELLHQCVNEFKINYNKNLKVFTFGKSSTADFFITSIEKKHHGSLVQGIYRSDEINYFIPFTDNASIHNSITCCAVLLYLNIDIDTIVDRMKELRPVEMRLELKQGINDCSIINDSYNADINSLGIALDFLAQQQHLTRKTVILSDLLQSGIPEEVLYGRIAAMLIEKNIYRFIGIGPQLTRFSNLFSAITRTDTYPTTAEFLKDLSNLHFKEEVILLKGARVFSFERISNRLEQKVHETVMEINLNALRNNLKAYRNALAKKVKMMVMVKAFGYGSGTFEIAGLLQQEGVEYLAVAYTDEGVELRKAGIRVPIMVMNAEENGFDKLLEYRLEPEIYSFKILHSFLQVLIQKNIQYYPIHLKLDTGMHRLGFLSADMNQLADILRQHQSLKIQSAFSHLVASEDPAQDDFTAMQGELFLQMTTQIEKAVGYTFLKHLANTAAIHRHPALQLDMVRLGIGLYGVDSHFNLLNVTTLKTTVSQIKQLKKGDTVGYGRKGKLYHDAQIATVRIGYADGYPRVMSNGKGKMLVNGILAPVIGNVCMDMTMLDVTGIDLNEGDEVIVFGANPSVKDLAAWADTIPYEILTGISQRVKRVYYEE